MQALEERSSCLGPQLDNRHSDRLEWVANTDMVELLRLRCFLLWDI